MSSPAGLQPPSHFLSRWMPSSSRAGVFLNGSPGEVASVRSSCNSQSLEMPLYDSFTSQFAPLSMSINSSCVSVDSVGPTQSRRDLGTEPSSSDVDPTRHIGGSQQALIDRLEQLKQLQQRMQEQLKSHKLEQLQKLQNEKQRLLGMVQTTTESRIWSQDQTLEQQLPEHHDDGDEEERHDNEESLQSITEDQSMCRKERDTMPRERPITLGLSGKTFEEILEEQLKLETEKQSKISVAPVEAPKVKRPFLRRGEGLSRFTRGKATVHSKDRAMHSNTNNAPLSQVPVVLSHQSSEPKNPSKPTNSMNVITQRKTAVLNKDNPSHNKVSAPTTKTVYKVHVHGVQQNVRPEAQNVRSSGAGHHQSSSSKQTEPQQKVNYEPKGTVMGQVECIDEYSEQIAENSFNVWLKQRGETWEREHLRECVELGEFELLERAADELSFSSNSSFIKNLLQRDGRRLSSTPVKLPLKSSFTEQNNNNVTGPVQNVTSKVLSPPGNRMKSTKHDEVMCESSKDERVEDYDSSVCSNTVFYQSDAVTNMQEPFRHCFQVSANPYRKDFYQDRERAFSPQEEDESNRYSTRVDVRGHVEFDDDDTWNEPEDSFHNPPKMESQPLKRKVAFSKGSVSDCFSASPLSCEPEQPTTCQLVAKLFPALKPKSSVPDLGQQDPEEHEQAAVRSKLLRERLVELETEIERFRTENAALSRHRQENQELKENLRKERSEFEKKMADELAKWEEFKHEEGRKLQREKKLFEKHAAAARARPDKQERDEIQSLKQQLNTLQEDLRKREARWSSTNSRLKQQVDGLSKENATLRDQVRILEKLRLTTWKNVETERERGRPNTSGSSVNTKRTKSKSPSSSTKSSPTESSNRNVESPEVQKPTTVPAKPPNTWSTGNNWQKEWYTVTPPDPISDRLTVFEGRSHDHHLMRDSTHSALEPDSSNAFTGLPEMGQNEITHTDGKIERALPDGGRLTIFPNGTRKEVSADGLSIRVTFFNGDIKHIMQDQRVIYYYAEAQTTHTTYPDGMEVLQFPNNQIEKHYADGRKEITFPDQTVKNLYPDGREESVLADGTIIQQNPDGSKQIQFNTGQRELHTAEFKRREYPDGTVKTVYIDGRQETRYPTGRVRLKDPQGRVIMDTKT